MSHRSIRVTDKIIMSDSESSDDDYEQHRALMLQCATIVTYAVGAAALYYGHPLYDKTPYHTSAAAAQSRTQVQPRTSANLTEVRSQVWAMEETGPMVRCMVRWAGIFCE